MGLLSGVVASVASDELQDALEKNRAEKASGNTTSETLDLDRTLNAGESTIINFRGHENQNLAANYPFESVDCTNQSDEGVTIYANQKHHLSLPIPSNGSFGDSYPNVGIYSIEIENNGNTSIELKNLTVTVSGDPEGVRRGGGI